MVLKSEDVRDYYNKFMKQKTLWYRTHGNIRIEKATKFFLNYIKSDSVVIDVGCGLGIATETIAKNAYKGRVVGLDISDENIWYATKTISEPNLSFHRLDIVNEIERVRSLIDRPVNCFVLCDTIEHIPEDERPNMFARLRELAAPDAKILITIPSEWYQNHLRVERPDELQIIDNNINAEILDREARRAGFALTYFSLVDMWKGSQYAHCVLDLVEELNRDVLRDKPMLKGPLVTRIANRLGRRKYLEKKYVTDVFG